MEPKAETKRPRASNSLTGHFWIVLLGVGMILQPKAIKREKGEHLRRTLMHVAKGWLKQVVIFLDNADQRDYKTQQDAFLLAQEIAARWPTTVFVTLRPETFHLSMKSGGTLSGYHPKAFTISPPRIDRVIEKRLRFGLRIPCGETYFVIHLYRRDDC